MTYETKVKITSSHSLNIFPLSTGRKSHTDKIASNLFTIRINSYQESGKFANSIKESIFIGPKNKCKVRFGKEGSSWKSAIL